MRYPASLLDDIRNRLPLSQVVGRRVQWDRRKTHPQRGDYWACCPFHQEKTPSFHADDRKGRYHCFGCGKTGDHFTFLTELEGLPFPEAVERLAAEAGVALPAPDPNAEARDQRQAGLVEVMEMATAFFEAELAGRNGAAARTYLDRRRIAPATRKAFRLGLAGSGKSALKQHLAGKGVSQELMIEAGLLVTGDAIPVSFDRFRDRIIFPITDLRGRVVGFGGRALSPDAQAKYLNSPETPLFKKGDLLYHHREAREAARAAGTVIAVEGYVDVIAMVQAGFAHTVAPLGTALTERQLQLLWRMAEEPILCFDGDAAGLRAARRAVDLALPHLKPGMSLRFALLPDGKDPDDLIGTSGAAAMEGVLAAAVPLVDMLWDRETADAQLDTPERRAGLDRRLAAIVEAIADPAVQKHYRQALAERAGRLFAAATVPRDTAPGPIRSRRGTRDDWRSAQSRGPTEPRYRPAAPTGISGQLRKSFSRRAAGPRLSEATLVLTALRHPGLLERHVDEFAALELAHPELDSLRRATLELAADGAPDAAQLRAALETRGFAAFLSRVERMVGDSGAPQLRPGADEAVAERSWLQAVTLHRRARALHRELREAEAALAREGTAESLGRLIEIQRQLVNADGVEAAAEGSGEGVETRRVL